MLAAKNAQTDRWLRQTKLKERPFLILMCMQGLYAVLCDELERVSPEDNEYCLLLSNAADDLDSFISGIQRLREAPP